ncbi:hypothetical protein RI367_002588 [Sorochytrium milnesiophthora]
MSPAAFINMYMRQVGGGRTISGIAYVGDAACFAKTTNGMDEIVAAIERFNKATAIRANAKKGNILVLNLPRGHAR